MNTLIIHLLLLLLPATQTSTGDTQKQVNNQGLTLLEEVYDYGKIRKKDKVAIHEFKVKNTGNKPVAITHVVTGCTCVDSKYTKQPIRPGQQGVIEIIYKTTSKGAFNKRIAIFTSDEQRLTLTIKGEVIK